MKIAINALSATIGGGVTYLNRLLYYLQKMDHDNEYYIFVTPTNKKKVLSFKNIRFYPVEIRLKNIFHRLIYEQLGLPVAIKRLGVDVLYAPAEIAPVLSTCPIVLGIQNLNPYYQINIQRPWKDKIKLTIIRTMAKMSARRAKRIIFVSEACKSYVSQRLGIPFEKAYVIHHGVDVERFAPVKDSTASSKGIGDLSPVVGEDYILFVSNMSGHKNHRVLIEAYARLNEDLRRHHKLVLVGRRQSPWIDEAGEIIRKNSLGGSVIFTDEVAYDLIPVYYRGAAVFVMPSLLETFGIPLVEAMASGVPVIGADATAIPEILGGAGLLFDPYDPVDLAKKIEEVLCNSDLRAKLVQAGIARAQEFSWEKCARETLAVFREVAII